MKVDSTTMKPENAREGGSRRKEQETVEESRNVHILAEVTAERGIVVAGTRREERSPVTDISLSLSRRLPPILLRLDTDECPTARFNYKVYALTGASAQPEPLWTRRPEFPLERRRLRRYTQNQNGCGHSTRIVHLDSRSPFPCNPFPRVSLCSELIVDPFATKVVLLCAFAKLKLHLRHDW